MHTQARPATAGREFMREILKILRRDGGGGQAGIGGGNGITDRPAGAGAAIGQANNDDIDGFQPIFQFACLFFPLLAGAIGGAPI